MVVVLFALNSIVSDVLCQLLIGAGVAFVTYLLASLLFKDDNIEINLLKGIIKYICITKKEIVFDKDINISIDVNPNNIL